MNAAWSSTQTSTHNVAIPYWESEEASGSYETFWNGILRSAVSC